MIKTTTVKVETATTEVVEQQMVYGEVYAPNRPDAQGEFMTAEHIRAAAHGFMKSKKLDQIDVMHNNKVVKGLHVVESWIAGEDDKTYIPGSWVIGMHVDDDDLWQAIKKGEINGFSMEALVNKVEQEVDFHMPDEIIGKTSETAGHIHQFMARYNDEGKFIGGTTDMVDGHVHLIAAGTHTQETNGHTHRFSVIDEVVILQDE